MPALPEKCAHEMKLFALNRYNHGRQPAGSGPWQTETIGGDLAKMPDERPHIGIFVSFSGVGGVERMMVNLAAGLSALGCRVDLIPVKRASAFLDQLPSAVRLVDLGCRHTRAALPGLVRYLRRERPAALLSAKDRANQIAILARRFAAGPTRLVVRMGTTVSAFVGSTRPLKLRLKVFPIRRLYPQADAVVAVSRGVAQDLEQVVGLPPALLRVIPNPVITPELFRQATGPAPHPWFQDRSRPVLVSMGRLTRQKDFPTLIRAFALVRAERPCRLLILGGGQDRGALLDLARQLGVGADLELPGFTANPYGYLKHAACFVLSSIWEGSPNALTEALALGTPAVATDCPSGPAEILTGPLRPFLVPMLAVEPMAAAIRLALTAPPAAADLQFAVRRYTQDLSSRNYLQVLLLDFGHFQEKLEN